MKFVQIVMTNFTEDIKVIQITDGNIDPYVFKN